MITEGFQASIIDEMMSGAEAVIRKRLESMVVD
jgi:hypothetical protein